MDESDPVRRSGIDSSVVTGAEAGEPGVGDRRDVVAALASRLKERIYAILTVIAVTLGLALAGTASHLGAAVSVAGTALGLWLATIAGDQQAHSVVHRRFARGRELRRMLFVSSPLLSAAVGPLVLIAVSSLGVLPLSVALYVSVGVDTAALFAWGWLAGRQMGATRFAALGAGAVNLVIGAVVIVIKLVGGH